MPIAFILPHLDISFESDSFLNLSNDWLDSPASLLLALAGDLGAYI